ncbi:H-type lectin domain-containing protein [Aeromicrobium sp.]|uniref:H-type lectin domain-containing protein n=1 Tax=Aeromicrobium sp. TaxID=1871063 RepID=UPI003D6AFACD
MSPDIQFGGQPFANPPNVEVSLAGIEAAAGVSRVRLSMQNVQVEEFNIRVTTTDDTALNWVSVAWVAHDGA